MKVFRVDLPSRPIIKFVWGDIPILELLLQLRPLSYYSHNTALIFNGLIRNKAQILYVNSEQPEKKLNNNVLMQENIDRVFKGKPRITKSITNVNEDKVCFINGKFTNKLNVIKKNIGGASIEFTNIERTLIDIVVRPQYSGDFKTIVNVYKSARSKFSVIELINTLKQLNHKYPYHQPIGFLMKCAGNYKKEEMDMLKDLGLKYDFYLQYGIKKKDLAFCKEWRIHHSKDLGF